MEFKKLSEVTSVETVADSANVLVEQDGEIVRAPKGAIGPFFVTISYDGSNYTANMTYAEVVAALEAKTIMGGCYYDEENKAHTASYVQNYLDNHSVGPIIVVYVDDIGKLMIKMDGTVGPFLEE